MDPDPLPKAAHTPLLALENTVNRTHPVVET